MPTFAFDDYIIASGIAETITTWGGSSTCFRCNKIFCLWCTAGTNSNTKGWQRFCNVISYDNKIIEFKNCHSASRLIHTSYFQQKLFQIEVIWK